MTSLSTSPSSTHLENSMHPIAIAMQQGLKIDDSYGMHDSHISNQGTLRTVNIVD